MKIVCYYNKNLKMSEGKLAAQVGHVCKELGICLIESEKPKVEEVFMPIYSNVPYELFGERVE